MRERARVLPHLDSVVIDVVLARLLLVVPILLDLFQTPRPGLSFHHDLPAAVQAVVFDAPRHGDIALLLGFVRDRCLWARKRPEQALDTLRTISATGRASLAEMRKVLGLLRNDTAAAELAPMPSSWFAPASECWWSPRTTRRSSARQATVSPP